MKEIAIFTIIYIVSLLFTASENSNVIPVGLFAGLGVTYVLDLVLSSRFLPSTKNIVLIVLSILSVVYCCLFSSAVWYKYDESLTSGHQEILADILDYEIENPTLICYNLDNFGLYTDNGVGIETYFFATNSAVENNKDYQMQMLNNLWDKETHFALITSDFYINNKKDLLKEFNLVNEYKINTFDNFITTEQEVVLLIRK